MRGYKNKAAKEIRAFRLELMNHIRRQDRVIDQLLYNQSQICYLVLNGQMTRERLDSMMKLYMDQERLATAPLVVLEKELGRISFPVS